MLCEKIVYTEEYGGTIDLLTGFEDFPSNIDYDDEFHTYRLNGKIIPSVTQLLDDGEYKNVDEKILEYARKKGTLVHKEIQEYLEENKKGITNEFYEFMRLYKKESKKFKPVPVRGTTEAANPYFWSYQSVEGAPKYMRGCKGSSISSAPPLTSRDLSGTKTAVKIRAASKS